MADAVEFLTASGTGQTMLRGADPATVGRVAEAMRAALRSRLTPDGVRLGSRAWLATARAPGE